MNMFDPANLALGAIISNSVNENKRYTPKHVVLCGKCAHYRSSADECVFYTTEATLIVHSAKDMRECNVYAFRFWKNCGDNGKFFKEKEV